MSDELKVLLHTYDPAKGKALSAYDRTRILQRALSSPRRRRLRFAAAFAVLVLFIGGTMAFYRAARKAPAAPRDPARQIQYATPGGTRIVWTLDPNFRM